MEDDFKRLLEVSGNLQSKHGRWHVSPGLDGDNGVAADADGFGQLLLSDVLDGSLYSDCVLHKGYCILDFTINPLNVIKYTMNSRTGSIMRKISLKNAPSVLSALEKRKVGFSSRIMLRIISITKKTYPVIPVAFMRYVIIISSSSFSFDIQMKKKARRVMT